MLRLLTSSLVVVLLSAVGCSDAPTGPSPGAGTVTDVTVTSAGATSGPTFQLTATARHADGSTEDVTSTATWESSNPELAMVSAGTVTVVGHGEVDMRATFRGVTGALHMLVARSPVADVSITGPVSGPAFQLAAMAHFADGSTLDVTRTATWDTSNAQVATVSATGFVTVAATGQAEIRALYQGTVGRRVIDVSTTTFAIIGLAREVAPGSRPVNGATARLLDGRTPEVMSDAGGSFIFRYVPPGRFLLEVEAPGFELWRGDGTITDGDVRVTAELYPTPPVDATGATATARCQDGGWSWASTLAAACTANGGVAYPVCPGALCTSSAPPANAVR